MGWIQPLRPGDPAAVGGHVLLGRLGAGGMGVVYLGRSRGGAPAAVKVIRAEHAADPGFRVRFRREAEAAGRVASPWLVPVTAADPDAPAPWLATAFVPGPSLAQAVDGYGALPARTVRVLGLRLAEALTRVHAAGLVHRDVKPGNVLLALDGPRLIDFGIARAEGATALTATGLVIGSPGFLAPEQAQGGAGPVGPPSDVFALGCVLAYAATGRRPFAAATVAGALFRTVHEEPDLDGAPSALLPLLRECLAKAPQQRPTAESVHRTLAEASGVELAASEGELADGWLPAPFPGIIAERSAEVLALPDPEPVTASDPVTLAAPSLPAPHRPSRRRLLALGSAAALFTAGGTAAAIRLTGTGKANSGQSGARPRYLIGLQADLSGPLSALGRAQERGARLAVAHFNADESHPFELELSVRDDRGEAARAVRVARQFLADERVCALLGPTGEAGVEAVAARCEEALLPLVSVSSATAAIGSDHRTFFQLRPDRNALTTGFLHYLSAVRPSERTALVDDRAATGDQDWRLAEQIRQFPPAEGTTTTHAVPAGSEDFGPAVAAVRAAKAQAVVYVGASPHRAARCARALDRAGFTGARMAPEPVLRPQLPSGGGRAVLPFLREAGAAAEGWVCVTSYADPQLLPAAREFTADYRKRYPAPPALGPTAPFAVEAYDALLLVASALRPPAEGGPERGSTARRLRAAHRDGLAKRLGFGADTGAFDWRPGLFLYRVERGAPVFLGHYESAKPPR